MKINEVMSKNIIYASDDNTIEEVASLMKTYDIGFLPVKDKDNYIGVITDRDLIIRAISNDTLIKDKIKNFITKDIISIDSECDINEALELMSEYQIRRLMIKHENKYVGILSLSDILSSDLDNKILIFIARIFMPSNQDLTENDINLPQAEIDEFDL